jgi:hypothetical protein
MKRKFVSLKPRDTAVLAMRHCKGGPHGKTRKAQRRHDKQNLKNAMHRSELEQTIDRFLKFI